VPVLTNLKRAEYLPRLHACQDLAIVVSRKPRFLLVSEFLLVALCAFILTAQLFVPPLIGLADNGDFSKVLGRVGLRKSAGDNFQYFVSDYPHASSWNTVVWYSEVVPAGIAVGLQTMIRGHRDFDIRYLAAIHTAIFVGLYYFVLLLLRRVRTFPRVVLALLVLWIFTDVAYVAYLNSFYSDTIAWLSLVAMVVSALHIVFRSRRPWLWWSVYAMAALFFAASKPQHAIWAIFPAAFAVAMTWHASGLRRVFSAALCLVLLTLGLLELASLPGAMKAMPLFDVVFLKLTANPNGRAQVLNDLGLPASDSRYVGTSAWTAGSPIFDVQWRTNFYAQVGHRLLWFYFSHPRLVAQVMRNELRSSAPFLRPPLLANYRREDGFPPNSLAGHFCSWSDLRARMFRTWPEHIVLWYVFVLATAIVVMGRIGSPVARKVAAICLALAVMGIGEFCFASLTDAAQTDRHLFLFHALTDLTVVMTAAAGLELVSRLAARKRSA
jgi:hypothetical protein